MTLARRGARLVHCCQNAARVREKHFAGRQKKHASRRTREERHAELLFETLHVAAERRLCNAQAASGAADVSFFGNRNEVANLREAHMLRRVTLPDHRRKRDTREIETVLDAGGRLAER